MIDLQHIDARAEPLTEEKVQAILLGCRIRTGKAARKLSAEWYELKYYPKWKEGWLQLKILRETPYPERTAMLYHFLVTLHLHHCLSHTHQRLVGPITLCDAMDEQVALLCQNVSRNPPWREWWLLQHIPGYR